VPDHRWLADITTDADNGRVLYAVPHAGAGAAAVKRTGRLMAGRLDTTAVRLPGRESLLDAEPWTELAEVAEELARQILAHAGEREIVLYGHCSGAVVAYETARRLPPGRVPVLLVSANESPDRVPVADAWRLPTEEFLAKVADDGYLPGSILADPELAALVELTLRADYRLIETHPHSVEPLAVPIRAFVGAEERSVRPEDIAAWESYSSAGFRLDTLPGGHNLLLEQPAELAEALLAAVAEVARPV
jgi:medium-chain acyl-[acyl-carrier-protein] hydrolase